VIGYSFVSCPRLLKRTRSNFPHFRRWVKITAVMEPFFSASVEASDVLFNFLALHAGDVLLHPKFLAGGSPCFRPSTSMLTALATIPNAVAVGIPPLYNQKPFDTALHAGQINVPI